MATAPENLVETCMIENNLICGLCWSFFRDPKDLDCRHVYCFDCLDEYVQEELIIDCPKCRYITVIPHGSLTNLKSNHHLKNLVEKFKKGKVSMSSKRQKLMEIPECPNHIGERQHFFCVTCNISVCYNCIVLKHPKPQHEIRERKEVKEKDKTKRQKKQELENLERKLKYAKEQAEQEVKTHVQYVTTEMITWEKKMYMDIHTTYQKRMKILQEKQTRLEELPTKDDERLHDMTVLKLVHGPLTSSSFGVLVTSRSDPPVTSVNQLQDGSANKKLNLTHLTEFKDFDDPGSVAANHSNSITVGDIWTTNIIIYGKYNGEYKQSCRLRLSNQPRSFAISSKGKFFVSDGGAVKEFSSKGIYKRSWPRSVDADKIAITPFDLIVIGSRSRKEITVHKCDGELIRTHHVGDANEFYGIASNAKQIAFTTGNAVYVIDFMFGHKVWKLRMSHPFGICYEQKTDTLLVSRGSLQAGHGVIEQYSSTIGQLISCLASDLYYPHGMTITQDNKLVVADRVTLKIYNIN